MKIKNLKSTFFFGMYIIIISSGNYKAGRWGAAGFKMSTNIVVVVDEESHGK